MIMMKVTSMKSDTVTGGAKALFPQALTTQWPPGKKQFLSRPRHCANAGSASGMMPQWACACREVSSLARASLNLWHRHGCGASQSPQATCQSLAWPWALVESDGPEPYRQVPASMGPGTAVTLSSRKASLGCLRRRRRFSVCQARTSIQASSWDEDLGYLHARSLQEESQHDDVEDSGQRRQR